MGSAVKKITSKVFGGGGSPGMLGTGRFKASKRDINKEPFTREVAGAGTQEELRKKQLAQSERLEARSKGEAPSIAEAQLKQAQDRSLAQQLGAAQTRRGGSAASRERQLSRAQASSGQQIAQAAASAKLQERQLADQSLAQQLQSQRSQDINISESDRSSAQALEQLETKQHLAAEGANLSGFQSAAQQRSGLISGIGGGLASFAGLSDENEKKDIKDESDSESNLASAIAKKKNVPSKDSKDSKDSKSEKASGLATFAKGFKEGKERDEKSKKPQSSFGQDLLNQQIASLSDKNQKSSVKSYSDKNKKKNVESASPKAFLDALTPYSYNYKDPSKPGAGEGRHLSVMAQDLEKAGPVGASMVEDTKEGKIVNYGSGFGAILAAQVHLNDRLKDIESKKSKKKES